MTGVQKRDCYEQNYRNDDILFLSITRHRRGLLGEPASKTKLPKTQAYAILFEYPEDFNSFCLDAQAQCPAGDVFDFIVLFRKLKVLIDEVFFIIASLL